MRGITTVLTDLDGTILYPNGDFSVASKQIVQQLSDQGISVMPVTGRSYESSADLCKQIGLNGMGVFNGGALIADVPTGKVLWERPLEGSSVRLLLKEISPYSTYLSFGYGRMAAYEAMAMATKDIYCLSLWVEARQENLGNILSIVRKFKNITAHTNATFIDESVGIQINHYEANKLFGAQQLLNLAKVHSSCALAIGDDNNDIPFFKAVGISVAMGNASEELKRIAAYTTVSISEDGFSHAMTKYVLRSK